MGFVGLVYLMQMVEQEMSNRFSSGEASIENNVRSCTKTYPETVGHHVTTLEGTV